MCTQSYQFDDVSFLVEPYQQEVALHMTFHASFVLTEKHVGFVSCRDGLFVSQHVDYLP